MASQDLALVMIASPELLHWAALGNMQTLWRYPSYLLVLFLTWPRLINKTVSLNTELILEPSRYAAGTVIVKYWKNKDYRQKAAILFV